MQEITSLQNDLVKNITSLHNKKNRNQQKLFLLEGYKNIFEAISYGLELEYLFIKKDLKKNIENVDNDKIYLCDDKVLKKISTTSSAPEIVGVVKQIKCKKEDLFNSEKPIIIALENIKDAGNLGTIIRTAKACNISGIILLGDTIDIYNPKVIRSTAGNLWKIPVIKMNVEYFKEKLLKENKNFQFIATTLEKDKELVQIDKLDFSRPTVLIFGSESHGITDEIKNIADIFTYIPINKDVESLNLSSTVAMFSYESMRG